MKGNNIRKIVLNVVLIFAIVINIIACSSVDINNSKSDIHNIRLVTDYNDDVLVDGIDAITFGRYPQSKVNDSELEPIEWLVLERDDEKVLLISKYILECKSYNEEYIDITWENSTIRKWLNDDFYNIAFNDDEKKKILDSKVVNNVIEYKFNGGNDTSDKIYLLSSSEVIKYFFKTYPENENKKVVAKPTEYSKRNLGNVRVFIEGVPGDFWFSKYSLWWLRTPGDEKNEVATIRNTGFLNKKGDRVHNFACGIRPVMLMSIK